MSSFKRIEKKHDVCRGKDCKENFCESLRKHTTKKLILKPENEVLDKRAEGII